MNIPEINNWLENRAISWENTIKNNPSLSGSNWPEYFRGLKDFHLKEGFILSSADMANPIIDYLNINCSGQYKFDGYTGYCIVTKI